MADTTDLPDLATLYAQWERNDGSVTVWQVLEAENVHYAAQEPIEPTPQNKPPRLTIVMDRDGDGWVLARTLWHRISDTPKKWRRIPVHSLAQAHGPLRIVGTQGDVVKGIPTVWTYKTIRPRGM